MIQVVSAFIVRDGRILLQQRRPPRDFAFTWECPGGKLEPGDVDAISALQRELDEEIGWQRRYAGEIDLSPFFVTSFSAEEMPKALTLSFRHVRPEGWWNPKLIDGVGLGWFTPMEMVGLNLTPGNRRLRDQVLLFSGQQIPGFPRVDK